MTATFIHLHTHSSFSLAEGALHIKDITTRCADMALPAIAITDTNNLFGALEASETLSGANIQSITGIELRIRMEVGGAPLLTEDGRPVSMVLLAQNEVGYKALLALTSASFLETSGGEDPAVPLEKVLAESDGVICLTGGGDGPVDALLRADKADEAASLMTALEQSFGDRLYIEVQRHPSAEATDKDGRYPGETALLKMAFDRDLPIVATNNAYFPTRADHAAHDALLCIAGGNYISQTERRQVSEDHYFKSPQEMEALFSDLPEALEATVEIAQRCAFRPRTFPPILPSFAGDLEGEKRALQEQAEAGLRKRLAEIELAAPEEAYHARLEKELGIINRMGFPGYFLIVADFIKWAKDHDIPVGPGRGSGAGSLVAYALTITDLDPLRFNLLFERFLNPERVSMPDFDVDFCQDRRDEVIAYVQDRYGDDRVAQIITFGKLQARAVLRDVGRVLQMPFGQVDRLCKLVPNNPANPVTLDEAIKGEPRFAEEQERDGAVGTLLDIARRLEGLYRHASTHAAGVVIGDRPLHELVPLYQDPKSDMPATQFNMKWVEPAGLVKFDFLGLKTLTVIKKAIDYLSGSGTELDIDRISLKDTTTYDMLSRGDAIGVFQLESAGMRSTLKGLNADCLEDIIALVSLYRPGPMDNIPTYIDRKAGREDPDYLHPLLEDVLKETYGVIIYQEQVMQIAQILSGYSLGEADLLRRAMGKKKKEEMDKQKVRFVKGAEDNKVSAAKAESIFELVAKFAGYGFNKSHAAAYAWISYQTAFLKANHPAAFLAASMSLDIALTDKLSMFVSEASRCDVVVQPPCINQSQADFSVVDGAIHYALAAIKNVGDDAMAHIGAVREEGGEFSDIYDFSERVDLRRLGKRGVQQLAKAGAFDRVHPNRAQIFESADFLCRYSATCHEEKGSMQGGLFGGSPQTTLERPVLAARDDWSSLDRLEHECAALGFYLTGHPLDDYAEALSARGVVSITDVMNTVKDTKTAVQMAGIVREVTRRRSRSGKPFAWVSLSDRTGDFEVTVFSEVLEAGRDHWEPGSRLFMSVTAEEREGALRLTGEAVRALDDIHTEAAAVQTLKVCIDDPQALSTVQRHLQALPVTPGRNGQIVLVLAAHKAQCEVEMVLDMPLGAPAAAKGVLRSIQGVRDVVVT